MVGISFAACIVAFYDTSSPTYTVSFSTADFDELIQVLQSESQILLDRFQEKYMQANPDKFQVIAVGKRTFGKNLV